MMGAKQPRSALIPFAVGGAALLAVAAAGLFYYASQTATGPERGTIHQVTVGQKACDPMDFTLPAGRQTFQIHNASDRPIEWEILDGVMVVEERENIAPGFHSLMTEKLKPGTYQITCGLLSNPRGQLVVTPSAESEALRISPPITAFIGPLSEVKVYLVTQSGQLTRAADLLEQAIQAGDLDGAKAAWLAARLPYKRIETVTGRVADLENAINPLSDYLELREADPAFTGFHRIEYGLWHLGSTDGLLPMAQRLSKDVTSLGDRLRQMKLAPDDLAGSAARQADRLAMGQISAGEDRWADADLPEIEAGLDGIAKLAGLLQDLLSDADPDTAARYQDSLAAARSDLAALKNAAEYPPFSTVDQSRREQLAKAFSALALNISAINPSIGLE